MIDQLDFLVRFWELSGRHAALGQPLGPGERRELLSLLQLVTADLEVPAVGMVERPRHALPAQLIGDGTILPVEIRRVAAGAVIVGGSGAMPAGAHAVLRAADVVTGVEYVLPCMVHWVYESKPSTRILALGVDGIPTRTTFVGVAEPRLRATPHLGRHARIEG